MPETDAPPCRSEETLGYRGEKSNFSPAAGLCPPELSPEEERLSLIELIRRELRGGSGGWHVLGPVAM
jgi:hypothetical protein